MHGRYFPEARLGGLLCRFGRSLKRWESCKVTNVHDQRRTYMHVCMCVAIYAYQTLCLYVYIYMSISTSMCMSVPLFVSISTSIYVYIHIYIISIPIPTYRPVSTPTPGSIHAIPISLSLYIYTCQSVCNYIYIKQRFMQIDSCFLFCIQIHVLYLHIYIQTHTNICTKIRIFT